MSTRSETTADDPARNGGSRTPLVLGLGNLLLGDDAVGLRMLEALEQDADDWAPGVDFVDGGTQGLALLGVLSGRPWTVVLDAVARLAPPGTVMVLNGEQALAVDAVTTGTAHEGGAAALLAIASLTGDLPARVVVVGVVPEIVRTGIGLSPVVERALAAAVGVARGEISRLGADSPVPRAPEPAAAG